MNCALPSGRPVPSAARMLAKALSFPVSGAMSAAKSDIGTGGSGKGTYNYFTVGTPSGKFLKWTPEHGVQPLN